VRPNVTLAAQAGIPLGTSGGIAVDARMRTQVEGVWAAGDCSSPPAKHSRPSKPT
jgi:pyruvate/2-oxoglutarate dehydrogenase complex dihydrolipoamide dehydrogenase (E3) component